MATYPASVERLDVDDTLRSLGRWVTSFVDHFGVEVLREFARFAREAEPGAMLTVRCTRNGFTAQLTGPIVGGRPEPVSIADVYDLIEGSG